MAVDRAPTSLLNGDDGGSGLAAFNIVFKLFAELFDEAEGGHRSGVAERAEGAAHHVFGEVLDVVDVFFGAATGVDAGEGLLDPVGAFAAGDAPAAGLVLVEGDGAEGEFDDGDGLVEHDDAAGSEHGAGLGHLVEVEAYVDLVCGEDWAGGAAGDDGFELLAVFDAAGYIVDRLAEAVAHGELVDARALDVAADAEEACAAVAFGAELGVGLAAHEEDVRGVGDGLGVVDDGGATVKADDGREGRLDARDAALAFERLHEGGLFADLVGSCAGLGDDVEVDASAEDVFAEEASGVSVGYGFFDDLEEVAVLAAQIDEAELGADGEAGDHGAFDDGVWVFEEDDVVFAGARLGLVAVDQDVFGLLGLFGYEGPLHAGGESGSAASAQAAGFHGVDDPLGAFGDGLLDGFVAIELEVLVDVGCAHAEAARDYFDFIRMRDEGRHLLHVLSLAVAVGFDDLVDLDGGEIVVEVVVDLHGGGPAAGADALDFFQRKGAVGSDSFMADAELGLAVIEDLVATAQHAGDVGADLQVVLAGWLGAQHGVVRKHVAYVQLKNADALGDLGDDGVGDIADLILRVEQHGHERRALERVDGYEMVEAGGQLRRKNCVGYFTHCASSPAPVFRRQGPSLRRYRSV